MPHSSCSGTCCRNRGVDYLVTSLGSFHNIIDWAPLQLPYHRQSRGTPTKLKAEADESLELGAFPMYTCDLNSYCRRGRHVSSLLMVGQKQEQNALLPLQTPLIHYAAVMISGINCSKTKAVHVFLQLLQSMMEKELCNYPTVPASPRALPTAAADTLTDIDAEICSRRNEFCEMFMAVFDADRSTAIEMASRLESKGILPQDLPFMLRYVTTYTALMQRKKEMSADNSLPTAIAAIAPAWRPDVLPSGPHVTMADVVTELRAARYLNTQLLLEVATLRRQVDFIGTPIIFNYESEPFRLHLRVWTSEGASLTRFEGAASIVGSAGLTTKSTAYTHSITCNELGGYKHSDLFLDHYIDPPQHHAGGIKTDNAVFLMSKATGQRVFAISWLKYVLDNGKISYSCLVSSAQPGVHVYQSRRNKEPILPIA